MLDKVTIYDVSKGKVYTEIVEIEKIEEEYIEPIPTADEKIQALEAVSYNLISTLWDTDFRVCEIEWTLEDAGLATPVTTLKNIKLGGNKMVLTRFEQAKMLILAGKHDKERMTYQLTRYLERGYIKQSEYDELISLMEVKEFVVGE